MARTRHTDGQNETLMVSVNEKDGVIHHYLLPYDYQIERVKTTFPQMSLMGRLRNMWNLWKHSLNTFPWDLVRVHPPSVIDTTSLKQMKYDSSLWTTAATLTNRYGHYND